MRKHMKKLAVLLTVFIAAGLLAGCGKSTELADCFDEAEVLSKAENAITVANEEGFDAYYALWDDSLKANILEKDFNEQFLARVEKEGEFKGIGKEAVIGQTDEKTGKNYAIAVVIGEYTDGKIQYTISFDEDMNMIQFFIK